MTPSNTKPINNQTFNMQQRLYTLNERPDGEGTAYHAGMPNSIISSPSLAKAVQYLIERGWHIDQLFMDTRYDERLILVSRPNNGDF